jgi:enoyl-CoA hydratase/carnithine racemase
VTRIALPERLSPESLDVLYAALYDAEDVRVLVGTESGFCQGMDLGAQGADVEAAFAQFARVLSEIRQAPTVAFVDGDARGGGVGLAAACDVVLATHRARFTLTEVLFGLVPGAILPALHDRLAPQKVRRLALTGLAADAEEALRIGLVDEIVPDESGLRNWTRALARAEPGASDVLRALLDEGFDAAVEKGGQATRDCLAGEAAQRRIAAFLDGGVPWSL